MLNRLQQMLGIDLRYYLRGGGFLALANIASLSLLFLTTWIFSNYSKETYGAYQYIQRILGMLVVFTLPGYYTAVVRAAAREMHGSLIVSVKRRLKFSLIGTAALIGAAFYFYAKGQADVAAGCLIGSTMFGLAVGLTDFGGFLNGRKLYGTFAAMNIGVSLMSTSATIGAICMSGNFLTILTANLASRGLGQLACTILAHRTRENDAIGEDFYQFGNRQTAVGALGSVAHHVDGVLVGSFYSFSVLAEYDIATKLTVPLHTIGPMLNRLLFPKMAAKSGRALAEKTLAKAVWLMGVLVLMGIAAYFLLPLVIRWLFPDYLASIAYGRWMVVSELIGLLVIYLETYYLSQDRLHKTFYFVIVVRPALTIVLLPILMPLFGVLGAILARMAARAAEALYLMTRLALGLDSHEEN